MLQLLARKEQKRAGEPTAKTSLAEVLRVIRSMIQGLSQTRPCSVSLEKRLQQATTGSYQRQSKKQRRLWHGYRATRGSVDHTSPKRERMSGGLPPELTRELRASIIHQDRSIPTFGRAAAR
jgi:hypothetical protein